MVEEVLTDWRFWIVAVGVILAIAETRWTVKRHNNILNGGKPGENLATIVILTAKAVERLEKDIRDLRKEFTEERGVRSLCARRVHDRIDNLGVENRSDSG
ncbi:hypothetical protein LCGC14_0231890 [marine sediment metagenome]|uniref:Uncharacterized protein n=1 Tax=marine sediment metagenome TaxID=412755 RepID=A0A0F9WUP2_9ZZZZ